MSNDIIFNQEDKTDLKKFKFSDKYEKERGKYALTQTLDYNSLQYSETMDYEIEIDGKKFYPGGSKEKMQERHSGKHGKNDWVWRWSKNAVEWGKKNDLFVIKGDRIYTKSYLYCRKKNGANELESIDATKSYTTLSYLDNKYSNDNGKKDLDKVFSNEETLFTNPKPVALISELAKMVDVKNNDIVLDFYAGSGTTGQAILELNKQDNGNRKFILVQLPEKLEADSVQSSFCKKMKLPENLSSITYERLKRVMMGKSSNNDDFEWGEKNKALGGNLTVLEVTEVANFDNSQEHNPFEVIDETLYGKEKFSSKKQKVQWVCENFENTQKYLEKVNIDGEKEKC